LQAHWCQETCTCECKEELNRTCNSLQHWNNQDCYCQCNNEITNCPPQKHFDNVACQCLCDEIKECCDINSLWVYSTDVCNCVCPDEAKIRAECAKKSIWMFDRDTCGCKCRRPPRCKQGKVDVNTCTCV
jgi:hypothetical protein